MMQRRHFKFIAELLKKSKVIVTDEDDYKDLVSYWAMKLNTTNPRFDRTKFINAVIEEELK